MREKAIASTAVTITDNVTHNLFASSLELENLASRRVRTNSWASSYSCGFGQAGGRAAYHVRRVSRGIVYSGRINREVGVSVVAC
jgi:hypothetical protein